VTKKIDFEALTGNRGLEKKGFARVSNVFIKRRAELGIHSTGCWVLLTLMSYQRDNGPCFPSMATIARANGFDVKTARRWIDKLAAENWIRIEKRPGQTTLVDLNPLYEHLAAMMDEASQEETSEIEQEVASMAAVASITPDPIPEIQPEVKAPPIPQEVEATPVEAEDDPALAEQMRRLEAKMAATKARNLAAKAEAKYAGMTPSERAFQESIDQPKPVAIASVADTRSGAERA
jgi:hypothetical protein